MPEILENFSLKSYNTFGVEAKCRWFVRIRSEDDLVQLFSDSRWASEKRLVLGGGSNLLFTRDFNGLVIRMEIPGIVDRQNENGDRSRARTVVCR